ncbi:IS630 family transposase [Bacteroides heparinolyticus]|uniref:IS630 family transposase n=2 Tax=Bacteroidales TaxID=171549 RepID=UPI0035A08F3B
MNKIDFRTLSETERFAFRRQAIRLKKSGRSQKEIAQIIGIRPATICQWCKDYEHEGQKGLIAKKRGVKSEDKKLLSDSQELLIQKMITDTMPDQLKLNFALWTRKAVKELVDRELQITIAETTMGDYLRKWGFTPQKPKKQAYEQCPKAVQKWLNEDYPSIKERAEKENAEIYWGDETGVQNQCHHGISYGPKGTTPIKKSMSKRFSVNMVSAVTNQGKVQFMIYSEAMNAERLIEFLKQLIQSSRRKIYLILDNLKVHHSKVVKEWVGKNQDKIALFFLPSYSPEMNPDEYLNCDLKQGISAKKSPKNKDILQNNVKQHMDLLTNNPERVKKYFKHKSIEYAA